MEVALKTNNTAVKGVNKTTAKSVPAFLNKLFAQVVPGYVPTRLGRIPCLTPDCSLLYSMVNDPDTDDFISWSKEGDSFLVPSSDRFAKEVLPRFFKHSNFGSFIPSLQQGVLKGEEEGQEILEFSNPNFLQAQPDLLCFIRRQKSRHDAEAGALDLPTLLTDLASIRKHQTAISADLKDLQQSNHALWQEAIQSRERHARQQETLNKILRFLATVFGGQVAGAEQEESPPGGSDVVLEEETSQEGEGSTNGASGGKEKGKGPAKARAIVLKKRSQLLLEDVVGRQDDRAKRLRTLSARLRDEAGDDHDHDKDAEIEEIPSSRASDELPTISSAPRMPPTASTSRAHTSSQALVYPGNSSDAYRFTTIPTPDSNSLNVTSTTGDSPAPDYHLSQDAINNMFGGGGLTSSTNQDALVSFLQSRSQSSATSTSGAGTSNTLFPGAIDMPSFPRTPGGNNVDFSRALMPSSPAIAAPTSNPLDALTSETGALFSHSDFSPDYRSAIRDSTQAIQDVTNEKADIDARTSALEAAIARLMQNLPEETRDQLSQQTGQGLDELSTSGPGAWSGGANGDLDLDKFLAQYDTNATSGQTPIDYSMYFDPDGPGGSPGLGGLGNLRSSGPQFQTGLPSDDDEDGEEEEEAEEEVKDNAANAASTSNGIVEVKPDDEPGTRETTPNPRAGSKSPSTPKAVSPKKAKTTAKAMKTTGANAATKKRKSEVVDEVEVATPGGSRKPARSRR